MNIYYSHSITDMKVQTVHLLQLMIMPNLARRELPHCLLRQTQAEGRAPTYIRRCLALRMRVGRLSLPQKKGLVRPKSQLNQNHRKDGTM